MKPPAYYKGREHTCAPASFEVERSVQRDLAVERLRVLLRRQSKVRYEDALATLLELPLVWEADVRRMILDLRDAGELESLAVLFTRCSTQSCGARHSMAARLCLAPFAA